MKVKVVNKSKHPLPEYKTENSAGLDLRANVDASIELGPLERVLVPTGIFIQLQQGTEAQVRPRSGLAIKQGLTVLNTPGTIDADYRGEVMVVLVNLSNTVQEVNDGDRIAQLIVASYHQIEWEESELLEETKRGTGGFGSTGKH